MSRSAQGWRVGVALVVLIVLAAACSSAPEVLSDKALELGTNSSPTSPAPDGFGFVAPDLSELPGTLMIGGAGPLRFAKPDGSAVRSVGGEALAVTQPTWSRDSERSISLRVLSAQTFETAVVDPDGVAVTNPARRPYFFFSWSGDGSLIAALGSGPFGTTLDILDRDGVPVASESLDAVSFYLAWEPGGTGLLVHRDETLELIPDPTDLSARVSLGTPGQWFLAPAWIPGTRDALIVEPSSAGNRLVRINVDSGDSSDLGPVSGGVGIVVSPNGDEAVLAHGSAVEGGGTILVSAPAQLAIDLIQEPEVLVPTEIVNVHTGARRSVSDEFSLWGEWSPDGESLLLLQVALGQPGADWVVWRDGEERRIGGVSLSDTFFLDYVPFSWQFVESPRLWSPDGAAFVYGGADLEGPGIFVADVDSGILVRVATGEVAFWSPR